MYKATIDYQTVEDDYNQGELLNSEGVSWGEILTATSKEQLKSLISDYTYCKWEDIGEPEDINGYNHATEYWAGYMANANNEGQATEQEIEQWKQGKCRLWSVHCHILVSEITEAKAIL